MTHLRQLGQLPPEEFLSPPARKAAAELRKLAARQLEADEIAVALAAESFDAQAALDDEALRTAAVRKGTPAGDVGAPHVEQLAKDRKSAQTQAESLEAAMVTVESELVAAIVGMAADEALSGRQALRDTAEAFRVAVEALVAARAALVAAATVAGFVADVRRTAGPGMPTVRYEPGAHGRTRLAPMHPTITDSPGMAGVELAAYFLDEAAGIVAPLNEGVSV